MKVEELSHHFYENLLDLQNDVAEYVEFFNAKRIHQKLGYKTPNQIEEMYWSGELELLSSEIEISKKASQPGVLPAESLAIAQTELQITLNLLQIPFSYQ